MQQLKSAMESTTSHGLPRMVTNKPLYVRITWLLMFLLMLGLFLKGFSEFVAKLQSRQVTTSLDADSVDFQFPDVYACFENPMSGSYPSYAGAETVAEINRQLNATAQKLLRFGVLATGSDSGAKEIEHDYSFVYPQSLEYRTLVDSLAHRMEQSLISSDLLYKLSTGMPNRIAIQASTFIHPNFLRCIQWTMNKTMTNDIMQYSSTFVLVTKLLMDARSAEIPVTEPSLVSQVYADGTPITLSDWSFSLEDLYTTDRSAGVRVFLTPPGEYPSDFVTSFSLGPGKHHTVEVDMTQQVYKDGQFECVNDEPDVQFANPYDQTPYNHSYSYSYCYYYEYHKQFQSLLNLSGDISPLPWDLRGSSYILNLTTDNNILSVIARYGMTNDASLTPIAQIAKDKCKSRKPCSTLDYSVSISSADWPTQSSLAPFVSSSIKQAWTKAKAKNLSVPALDFLLTGNASMVASYVRSNLLKVHFKPHRVLCDRVTFSIDYGLSNFISDIGGIMGIYLGMSLLTIYELVELAHDLVMVLKNRHASNVKPVLVNSGAS